MDEGSQEQRAIARKSSERVLQALAEHGQKSVAAAMGVDISTVSRLANPESPVSFESICTALAAMGLRVVSVTEKTVDPREWEAVVTLAERGIAKLRDNGGGA